MLALLLLFGVACLGSIFFPSNECELTVRTLSTASGVENVMNPKPLLRWETKKKMGMIIRWNIPFYVLLYNQLLLNPSIFMKICVCHIILRCMINKRRCYATWFVSTWNFIIHSKYLKCSYQNKYRCKEWTVKCLKSWIWFYSRHVNEFQIFFKSWLMQIQWLYSSNMDFHFLMNYFVPTIFEKL